MSSYSPRQSLNGSDSDFDFSVYSLSSELDLDFGLRGAAKSAPSADEKSAKTPTFALKQPESLLVLAAKHIALHFPFEAVETSPVIIPEELQCLIAFHSFPIDEDDIWLYSCLSSGGSYEFDQGDALWADKAVKDCVQIGFHLSANVLTSLHLTPGSNGMGERNRATSDGPIPSFIGIYNPASAFLTYSNSADDQHGRPAAPAPIPPNFGMSSLTATGSSSNHNQHHPHRGVNIEPGYPAHRVSLTFDRGRITSCSCTCTFDAEDACPHQTASAKLPPMGEIPRMSFLNTASTLAAASVTGQHPAAFSYQPMVLGDQNRLSENPSSFTSYWYPASRPVGLSTYVPNVRRPESGDGHEQQGTPHTTMPVTCSGTWCSHVVATCLFRIRQPNDVLLRAPISESLSKLSKHDLQKFAQNLICHVGPKKILPAAQSILDQLLASTDNAIKNSAGAPDPTAGGAIGDVAAWCFDGAVLEEKLRATLRRLCTSKPNMIYSDIGSLHSSSPSDVENFYFVLHSLRGNDPRGVWDLLSIIGDMMRRQDNNCVLLLEIVTRCIIDVQELMLWWYWVQVRSNDPSKGVRVQPLQAQYVAYWLCEEVAHLWRLACLNPDLRSSLSGSNSFLMGRFPSGSSIVSTTSSTSGGACGHTRSQPATACWLLQQITHRLKAFHVFALQQAGCPIPRPMRATSNSQVTTTANADRLVDNEFDRFLGFKPALAVCGLNWSVELPPTHGLSAEEFRACMPTFGGSRLAESCDQEVTTRAGLDTPASADFVNWMRTNKPLNGILWESEFCPPDLSSTADNLTAHVFNDLPNPTDEVELAFARSQALDAHGYTKQSLIWARYLACRLLYLSSQFSSDVEAIAFEVTAREALPNQSAFSTSQTQSNSQLTSEIKKVSSGENGSRTNSERASLGVSHSGTRNKRSHAFQPAASNSTGSTRDRLDIEATKWASKVITLLDQIRCLMECLTRQYTESVSGASPTSSANRITTSGRTLLAFRGPDPASVTVHLDDTASVVAQQPAIDNLHPIRDPWVCVDIELAFRLGFYGLSLPRPPTRSPALEVRLFDQEVALVTRLCRLPLHSACPHVLQNIRYEATIFGRSLSLFNQDILVPYNMAIYLFHQLVGINSKSSVTTNLNATTDRSVSSTAAPSGDTQTLPVSDRQSNYGRYASEILNRISGLGQGDVPETVRMPPVIAGCPVLTTGTILAGIGLPLALSSYIAQHNQSPSKASNDSCNTNYIRSLKLAQLQDTITSDADLGFLAVLSVIGARSRVPTSSYPYFIEGQWAQMDALVVYMMRYFRDDVAKLDRMLVHLLDRHYNPHFKAPPLWACVSLPPNDLMRYELADESDESLPEALNRESSAIRFLSSSSGTILPEQIVDLIDNESYNVTPITAPNQDLRVEDLPSVEDSTSSTTYEQTGESVEGVPVVDQPSIIYSDENTSPVMIPPNLPTEDPATSASEDTDTVSDSQLWEQKFRCATLYDPRKRLTQSIGMAAVDTSAPETTSSDNSPSAPRRLFCKPTPAHNVDTQTVLLGDSTSVPSASVVPSTHNVKLTTTLTCAPSSPDPRTEDACGSFIIPLVRVGVNAEPPYRDEPVVLVTDSPNTDVSFSGAADLVMIRPSNSDQIPCSTSEVPSAALSEPVDINPIEAEYAEVPKEYKRLPPQPLSESLSYHMFHLGRLVYKLAGGPSASGSMFVVEPPEAPGTVHRNLQLVGFQIGLYGVGLCNRLSQSWRSRTYSRHSEWVRQRVFELGIPAACILYHSWEHHLTAEELSGIAFQLSQENNRVLVDIATELCLSSLSHCITLKPPEIYRALSQCEEHSNVTLERGLLKIEQSAKHSPNAILPEIDFYLARSWYSLFELTMEKYKKLMVTEVTQSDRLDIQPSSTNSSIPEGHPSTSTTIQSSVQDELSSVPQCNQYTLQSNPFYLNGTQHHPSYHYHPSSEISSTNLTTTLPDQRWMEPCTGVTNVNIYPSSALNHANRFTIPSNFVPTVLAPHIYPAIGVNSRYPFQPTVGGNLSFGAPQQSAPQPLVPTALSAHAASFSTLNMYHYSNIGQPITTSISSNPILVNLAAANNDLNRFTLPSLTRPPPSSHQASFGAMSNESSSMVVNPASSGQGSSPNSDIDSNRPSNRPQSVTGDTPMTEDVNSTTAIGNSPVRSGATPQCISQTPVHQLEVTSGLYLRRAYVCATNAIEKIFITQNPVVQQTHARNSGSTRSSNRGSTGSTGGRHPHHHHHHHSSSNQRQKHTTSIAHDHHRGASGSGSSVLPLSLSGHHAAGGGPDQRLIQSLSSDMSRMCSLNNSVDTQLVKIWDANILWTLDVATRLGPATVHEYCNLVMKCVQFPSLMNEITTKVIDYFSKPPSSNTQTTSTAVLTLTNQACPDPNLSQNQSNTMAAPNPNVQLALSHPSFFPVQYHVYSPFQATIWPNNTNLPPVQSLTLHPTANLLTYPPPTTPTPHPCQIPLPVLATQQLPSYGGGLCVTTPGNHQPQLTDWLSQYNHHQQQQQLMGYSMHSPIHTVRQPPPTYSSHPIRQACPPSMGVENSTVSTPPAQELCQHSVDGNSLIERLVNHTHALFHKFIDQRLQFIGQGQSEWDDFVDLILKAYTVHLTIPATDYGLHWNNLLTRIRRHHKCSASLWQRILSGIHTTDMKLSS